MEHLPARMTSRTAVSASIETGSSYYEARSLADAEHIYGFDSSLTSSVCVFQIADGFGEEAWVDARPVTVLAWHLRGAPVTCLWGRHRDRVLAPSAVSLQPQGMPNRFAAGGSIRFAQIYLSDALIDNVADSIRAGARASRSMRDDLGSMCDPLLRDMLSGYLATAMNGASKLELEARAILICSHLLRRHHGLDPARSLPGGGLADWQLRRACDAMIDRLGQDISLEDLADIAGVSATHFSKAFKQSMGMPPFVWLRQRRIEYAKELLSDTRTSLADIAFSVGFSAQPQFTTAFRRETGFTPGQWRRGQHG